MSNSFWRAFGPGVIMASSCVGGSHIIASTQAGAFYGWQLAGFIVAVNLLKYPFFRLAFDYSSEHGRNLLAGYAGRGRGYLSVFLAFNLFATVVNVAGGTVLSAVLLGMLLPAADAAWLNASVLASFVVLLFSRQYQKLDAVSKALMLVLTLMTAVALLMALGHPAGGRAPDFTGASPWALAAVPFFAALTGWMPAPMELSVSSSMWVVEKMRLDKAYRRRRLLDFNVSYAVTILLALMFLALGALVQYGQAVEPLSGGRFIARFVDMYVSMMGEWTRIPMVLVALACIYGTTIVAVDGYSRGNQQAVRLMRGGADTPDQSERALRLWIVAACAVSWLVIQFFSGAVGKMVVFAMTASFVSAPVFAWLNLSLAGQCSGLPRWLVPLARIGLAYLVVAVAVYLIWA